MKVSRISMAGASGTAVLSCLALLLAACGNDAPTAHGNSGSAGNSSNGGSGGGGGSAGSLSAQTDPGWVPIHRLNNAEYNNAVADLLGTALRPADYFQAQTATGFNTNHGALANIDATGARAYFDAAKAVVDDVFANATLKAQVVTCQAVDAGDTSCASTIIEDLGRRAWRRPLAEAEVQELVARYSEARTMLEKDHEGAIAHVLRILLTAAPFTYFIERDADVQAAAVAKRPLQGYELAQRLSFALWGSLPDTALLDLAESGALTDPTTLGAQVDRLLDDPKGPRFVELFLQQWLNITRLGGHAVEPTLYPAWSEGMRAAMFSDANAFLGSFVYQQRPWTEFLTAPLDTSNQALATVFGADPPGIRRGFLSLPAYLTAESMPTRTSPTFRGKIVLDAVLCTTISLPTFPVPDLEMAGGAGVDPANIRAKLEAHRAAPDCAGCHSLLDPIGLGLENFDAIGRYRTVYESGAAITPTGTLDGQAFNGLGELVPLVSQNPLLASCPGEKLLSFALRRTARSEDDAYVQEIASKWQSGSIRSLIKELVLSDAFRSRKVAASAL